jgi:GT2 family glycosyltransferase
MTAAPSFSIILPTYNEAGDIADTLDAIERQTLPASEVIVVDGGSTDGTLELLTSRATRSRLVVIDEGRRRGVAAARNTGIDAATYEIVVLLNADVMPEPDFLARLAAHYQDGADYVSVNSRVANTGYLSARYLQAEHELRYPAHRVGWTEGFSARRALAAMARFPEQLPGLGGEDVVFFDRLRALSTRWVIDYGIVVPHRAPATLAAFWRQWQWRGNAIPHIETRLHGRPLTTVFLRRSAALAKSLALAALVLPNGVGAIARARKSPAGMRDVPGFWLMRHIQQAAHRYGEWQTLLQLVRHPHRRGPALHTPPAMLIRHRAPAGAETIERPDETSYREAA